MDLVRIIVTNPLKSGYMFKRRRLRFAQSFDRIYFTRFLIKDHQTNRY